MGLQEKFKIKNLISTFSYLVIFLIGLNFYLNKFTQKKNNDKEFFIKLNAINYFKGTEDPYLLATKLEINPTNFFSLPINFNKKYNYKTSTFSLNENNFRKNPFNITSKDEKKCIFFTGSSAGFGIGVSNDSKTIPSQLHKILGNEYLIYNLAIPSWNTRQELISLLNSINNLKVDNCKSIESISFTGTADIKSVVFNSNSKFFDDSDSHYALLNSPEQYNLLERRIEKLEKIESSIKYNFRIVLNKIYESLFGEINLFIRKNISTFIKNKDQTQTKIINQKMRNFINMQAKSFIQNQIIMHNIINDLGGRHLVFIQPDLKNKDYYDDNELWNYTNKIFSNYIYNNNCLEIYDLRKYLIADQKKYYYSGKNTPLSLKESILKQKFRNNDINQHFFYDNSHLTNKGSYKVANLISNKMMKINPKKEKCSIK